MWSEKAQFRILLPPLTDRIVLNILENARVIDIVTIGHEKFLFIVEKPTGATEQSVNDAMQNFMGRFPRLAYWQAEVGTTEIRITTWRVN